MTLLRFIFTFLYCLVGVSGFVAFIILKNYPAGILAAATGIINSVLSHLHLLHYKNKLQEWYSPQHLLQISCFGFYSFAFSFAALVYFTVIEIMERKPILPIPDSVIIPIIWAFITMKSGLFLLYFAQRYGREDRQLLIEEAAGAAETSDENDDDVSNPENLNP